MSAELATRRAKRTESEAKLEALQEGVDTAEKRIATLSKNIDYFLLNAPLMDFVAPTLKVEQVILPGLYHNINFTKIDRVDRCMTCHVAASRTGFEDDPTKEGVEGAAAHPPAARPVRWRHLAAPLRQLRLHHLPRRSRPRHRVLARRPQPGNAEQKTQWEKTYGWQRQQFLDNPILPPGMAYAGCVTCHAGAVWTPEGEGAGRRAASSSPTGLQRLPHDGSPGLQRICARPGRR